MNSLKLFHYLVGLTLTAATSSACSKNDSQKDQSSAAVAGGGSGGSGSGTWDPCQPPSYSSDFGIDLGMKLDPACEHKHCGQSCVPGGGGDSGLGGGTGHVCQATRLYKYCVPDPRQD